LKTPIWLVAIEQMLTTTESSGLTLRLAIVCNAVMTCAVAAAAAHGDLHFIGRRHHRPRAHGHLAGRKTGPVVQSIDLVRREALEQSLLHHDLAAATAFLGGLEDHVGSAVEVARLGEVARRAEQHRGMAIVAAGVHASCVLRLVLEGVALVHRQAIHVGAQSDGAPARLLFPGDDSDHAGFREAAMHLDAPAGELVRHEVRRAVLVEGELRMRMNVAPHRGELAVVAADAVDGGAHAVWIRCLCGLQP